MIEVECVLACKDFLGEGPVWSVREQRLYWVDLSKGLVQWWDPATNRHTVVGLGYSVGCLGLRAKGGLVMATKKGIATLDTASGAVQVLVHPEADQPGLRFNDGKPDRQGRFWAGSMAERVEDRPKLKGTLYRIDADHSVHVMETGVDVSNGLGWSPDNKTMYFTDTPTRSIFAYDFDAATGNIANRRVFATAADGTGGPDGLTVDSEGCVWSCRWGGWRVVRYDPQGKLMLEVPLPVERPTSCVFGGKDLDELYITSAALDMSVEERAKQPYAGGIFRIRPGVHGLPEGEYAG